MARKNRRDTIDENNVGVYHLTDRTVKCSFLCGNAASYAGRSVGHRREWLRDRLSYLASRFHVDVLGYSIAGNNLSLILRNRPDLARSLSNEGVIRAWWRISPDYRYQGQPGRITDKRMQRMLQDTDRIRECRQRLSSISWFMRYLKQPIAVRANDERGQHGHFWQKPFRCTPIELKHEFLARMAYVDLTPIRTGMSYELGQEACRFTSAFDRLSGIGGAHERTDRKSPLDTWLSSITYTSGHSRPAYESTTSTSQALVDVPQVRTVDSALEPFDASLSVPEYLMLLEFTKHVESGAPFEAPPAGLGRVLLRWGFTSPQSWLERYQSVRHKCLQLFGCPVNTMEEGELIVIELVNGSKTKQDGFLL